MKERMKNLVLGSMLAIGFGGGALSYGAAYHISRAPEVRKYDEIYGVAHSARECAKGQESYTEIRVIPVGDGQSSVPIIHAEIPADVPRARKTLEQLMTRVAGEPELAPALSSAVKANDCDLVLRIDDFCATTDAQRSKYTGLRSTYYCAAMAGLILGVAGLVGIFKDK